MAYNVDELRLAANSLQNAGMHLNAVTVRNKKQTVILREMLEQIRTMEVDLLRILADEVFQGDDEDEKIPANEILTSLDIEAIAGKLTQAAQRMVDDEYADSLLTTGVLLQFCRRVEEMGSDELPRGLRAVVKNPQLSSHDGKQTIIFDSVEVEADVESAN